jgi:hypothetical protein
MAAAHEAATAGIRHCKEEVVFMLTGFSRFHGVPNNPTQVRNRTCVG